MRGAARLFSALVVLLLCILGLISPAQASDDLIDSFTANYNIRQDGVIEVQESIVWRFGSSSGRHGINRDFIVREAWDDENDAVFRLENMKITSPDASAEVSVEKFDTGDREEQVRYRIGSPDETVTTPTATYNFSYELHGALRTADGDEQLYWDVLTASVPTVQNLSIKVIAPEGVQKVACFSGKVSSDTPCQFAQVEDGIGVFTQSPQLSGNVFTIAAGLKPGAVSNVQPTLVENKLVEKQKQLRNIAIGVGVGTAVVSVASAIGASRYVKRRRDERFEGVAPGNIPPDPANAPIIPDDGKTQIPVFFTPPKIPVAYAGVLEDGVFNSRETTATLVSLAVRGHIQIKGDAKTGGMTIRRTDNTGDILPYEQRLLQTIFAGGRMEADIDDYGQIETGHERLRSEVLNGLRNEGLFSRLSSRTADGKTSAGFILMAALIFFGSSGAGIISSLMKTPALAFLILLIPVAIAVFWALRKTRRGTRTAVGTALTDQVIGFREYISSAEADQLRFEEGQDIFSEYLPWAIVFGEADRWTRVCQQLIDMGRLSAETPYWYYGPNFFDMMYYSSWARMASNVERASSPEPSESGSSGFGGGSGFSGGFSGGGGGGSSMSSW